jgi:hypothetical protein
MCYRKIALTPFLLVFAAAALAAYEVNGVTLGASEKDIKKQFPVANCRPLEWPSRAADRRCDDSRISFAGVDASVTFYLRADAVEGFDVRFDHGNVKRVTDYLRVRYGAPMAEQPSLEWKAKGERARLSSEPGRRRASLLVWRGAFDEEIYKVR